tara:strand:+ start:1641 stop:2777 length:1137 start_codon:yes stop_codon:yes gene_type:complete
MAGFRNNRLVNSSSIEKIQKFNFIDKEQWKYTNFNHLSRFTFNEHFNENLLSIDKDDSTDLLFLNELLNKENNHYLKLFNKIIPQENQFILYNTSYFHNGYYINVNKNSNAYALIENKDLKSSKNNFINDRIFFNFNKNSKSTIFINEQNDEILKNNIVYELFLDDSSEVDFIIYSNQVNATKILNLSANIKSNAILNLYTVNISGELIKNNYYINLNNKNSQCNFNGIGLLNQKNHIDSYIEINHNKKHTTSNIRFNNVLNDYSKGIFYAKTTINENCSQSEATQNNQNMILSENSSVNSNPQLIINNDDVQCAHGSTTGEIDSDALFYMQTRGIGINEAKKILINSFLFDLVNSIKDDNILSLIKDNMNKWINHVN